MNEFYDEMQECVTELLTEFGEPGYINIERLQGATFDSIAGDNVGGSNKDFGLIGVVVDYDDSQIDGTRIKIDDKMVVLDFQNKPLKDDTFIIDGAKMKVVHIKIISPAGTVLAYKVQLRA